MGVRMDKFVIGLLVSFIFTGTTTLTWTTWKFLELGLSAAATLTGIPMLLGWICLVVVSLTFYIEVGEEVEE